MNPEMIKLFIKQALGSSLRAGANNLVTEMAESFSADELSKLIGLLQNVEKKKRGTVDTTATTR